MYKHKYHYIKCSLNSDYEQVKPVHTIVGSITDVGALYKAFQGVDCVMHLASLIDITMFPDEKRLFKINVEGKNELTFDFSYVL